MIPLGKKNDNLYFTDNFIYFVTKGHKATPTNMHFQEHQWVWSLLHEDIGKVIQRNDLWGKITYRVWFPAKDAVVVRIEAHSA